MLPINDTVHFTWMHLCTETTHICKETLTIWDCISPGCRRANVFFVVMLALLGIVITISNLIVVVVYSRQLKKASSVGYNSALSQTYYKLSLAFADLIMGALVCNLSIVNYFHSFRSLDTWPRLQENGYQPNSENGYYETNFHTARPGTGYYAFLVLTGALTFGSWTVSIYTLLACSADRLYGVCTLKHSSARAAIIPIVFIWLGSIIVGILPFLLDSMEYGGWVMVVFFCSTAVSQYVIMAGIIIPMLGMWVLNVIIYFVLKKRMGRLPDTGSRAMYVRQEDDSDTEHCDVSVTDSDGFQPENYVTRTLHQAEYHVSVTLAIVVGGFTLSFLPMIVAIAMSAGLSWHRTPSTENFIFWFSLLCVSNSFWNCVIYSLRHKDFRTEVKQIFCDIAGKLKRITWK